MRGSDDTGTVVGAAQPAPPDSVAVGVADSGNRPNGLLLLVAGAVNLRRVERERAASFKLALAATFIAVCVVAVALLGAAA